MHLGLQEARFSSNGDYCQVTMTHNISTSNLQGGNCSILFRFPGVKYGQCTWTSDRTVAIRFLTVVQSPVLSVGSQISLQPHFNISARNSDEDGPVRIVVNVSAIVVQAPVDPVIPQLRLSYAPMFKLCAGLTIDATQISGSGGRSWMFSQVDVTTIPATNSTALQQLLRRSISTASSIPIQLPSTYFIVDTLYIASITLCNFLNGCATANISTRAVNNTIRIAPAVTIAGDNQRSVKRSSSLTLTANVLSSGSTCSNSLKDNNIDYLWLLEEKDISSAVWSSSTLSRYTNSDTLQFHIPKYLLVSDCIYRITFIARDVSSQLSSNASVIVNVARAALVAKITPSIQSIVSGSSLQLSAATSYDPETQSVSSTDLMYTWSCFPHDWMGSIVQRAASNPAVLIIVANSSFVGKSMNLALTVATGDGRNSTVQRTYTIVASDVPAVSFVSGSDFTVNSQDALWIEGQVWSTSPISSQWDLNLAGSSDSLTVASLALPRVFSVLALRLTRSGVYFAANSLSGGLLYSLTLSAGASAKIVASIHVNLPPYGGMMQVTPTSGSELTTTFHIGTALWISEELPISYAFSTMSTVKSLPLRTLSELSYFTTLLPAGQARDNYLRNVTTEVADSLGAVSYAHTSVTCLPLVSTLAQALSLELLGNATSNAERSRALSLSIVVLNTVNCSTTAACSSLYRSSCSRLNNVCGNCLSGYVGVNGDSNTPCYALSDFVTSSGLVALSACRDDDQCPDLHKCDVVSGRCQVVPKSCPLDCSGHGTCGYVNVFTGLSVSNCSQLDVDCAAQCSCVTGYTDVDCGSEWTSSKDNQQRRKFLLDQMLVTVQSSNAEYSVLTGLVYGLQEILRTVDDVDDAVFDSTASLLAKVIVLLEEEDEDLTIEVVECLFQPLSLLMSFYVNNNTESTGDSLMLSTLSDNLQRLSSLISLELVSDDSSYTFISDSMRLASAHFPDTEQTYIMYAPQSIQEDVLNATNTRISSTGAMRVQVVQFANRLWQNNSTPLYSNILMVTHDALVNGENSSFIADIPLVISPQNASFKAEQVSYTCMAGEIAKVTRSCANVPTILNFYCNGVGGTWTQPCYATAIPTCAVVDISSQQALPTGNVSSNNICATTAYGSSSLSCQCVMQTSSVDNDNRRRIRSRRRMQTASTSHSIAIAVTFKTGSLRFPSTFVPANDGRAALEGGEARTFMVVSLCGALWALGCIALLVLLVRKAKGTAVKMKDRGMKVLDRAPLAGGLAAFDGHTFCARLEVYLSSVIPHVFRNSFQDGDSSWFRSVVAELERHHLYLRLIMDIRQGKMPFVKLAQVFTTFTAVQFFVSLLFNVEFPHNDGSCDPLTTREACLHRHFSHINPRHSFCRWNPEFYDASTQILGLCSYARPTISFEMNVYCAVLTSICTALLMRPLDYLFALLETPPKRRVLSAVASALLTRMNLQKQQGQGVLGHQQSKRTGSTATTSKRKRVILKPKMARPGDKQYQKYVMSQHRGSTGGGAGDSAVKVLVMTEELFGSFQQVKKMFQVWDDRMQMKGAAGDHTAAVDPESIAILARVSSRLPAVRPLNLDEDIHDVFRRFLADMSAQRLQLSPLELVEFDAAWQLPVSSQDLSESSISRTSSTTGAPLHGCCPAPKTAASILCQHLEQVRQQAKIEMENMEFVPEIDGGLYCLQLFFSDLLGGHATSAARIFRAKTQADFPMLWVLDQKRKSSLITAIVLLNLAGVYFIASRGIEQGRSWQRNYLVIVLFQLVFEVFIFETLECLWAHCIVPSLVYAEVQRIHLILQQLVIDLYNGLAHPLNEIIAAKQANPLNVPEYFHVSHMLARKYPELVQSRMILAYHARQPGAWSSLWIPPNESKAKKNQHLHSEPLHSSPAAHHAHTSVVESYSVPTVPHRNSTSKGGKSSIACVLCRSWFQSLGASSMLLLIASVSLLPFSVQRLVARVIESIIVSGVIYSWLKLTDKPLFFSVLCVVLTLLLVYAGYRLYLLCRNNAAVTHEVMTEAAIVRDQHAHTLLSQAHTEPSKDGDMFMLRSTHLSSSRDIIIRPTFRQITVVAAETSEQQLQTRVRTRSHHRSDDPQPLQVAVLDRIESMQEQGEGRWGGRWGGGEGSDPSSVSSLGMVQYEDEDDNEEELCRVHQPINVTPSRSRVTSHGYDGDENRRSRNTSFDSPKLLPQPSWKRLLLETKPITMQATSNDTQQQQQQQARPQRSYLSSSSSDSTDEAGHAKKAGKISEVRSAQRIKSRSTDPAGVFSQPTSYPASQRASFLTQTTLVHQHPQLLGDIVRSLSNDSAPAHSSDVELGDRVPNNHVALTTRRALEHVVDDDISDVIDLDGDSPRISPR